LGEEVAFNRDSILLDGHNRYLACLKVGRESRFREWDGSGSLVAFVVSLNLYRRHLTESQRAMVAAKIATLEDGQRQVGKFADVPTQSESAELLNVSERSVRHARQDLPEAAEELVTAVEQSIAGAKCFFAVTAAPAYNDGKCCLKKEMEDVVQNGGGGDGIRERVATRCSTLQNILFTTWVCSSPVADCRFHDVLKKKDRGVQDHPQSI
jgi:hypothetical protein